MAGIKKAQTGPIAFIVLVVITIIVLSQIGGNLWGLWIYAGENASLTGVGAFVYDNPVLFFMIGLFLGLIGWFYFGSE